MHRLRIIWSHVRLYGEEFLYGFLHGYKTACFIAGIVNLIAAIYWAVQHVPVANQTDADQWVEEHPTATLVLSLIGAVAGVAAVYYCYTRTFEAIRIEHERRMAKYRAASV